MKLMGYLELYIKIVTIKEDEESNNYIAIKTDFKKIPTEMDCVELLKNIKRKLSEEIKVKEIRFCTKEEYENSNAVEAIKYTFDEEKTEIEALNKVKREKLSCVDCEHTCHYYPTADSFDMDRVLVCTKTNRKSPDNEIGYGRKREDFLIPEWCPLRN